MIVLDTNVVSQILRGQSPIDDWLTNQFTANLALTTVTIAEVAYGIARLPSGRRRTMLAETWGQVEAGWVGRVLGLGAAEARSAGLAKARRAGIGRPITDSDAYIAGICVVHNASLATRNSKDFEGLGITLIDPWA